MRKVDADRRKKTTAEQFADWFSGKTGQATTDLSLIHIWRVRDRVMPAFARELDIRAAALKNDAGLVGAVRYFLDSGLQK